jgi:hypothetical protein
VWPQAADALDIAVAGTTIRLLISDVADPGTQELLRRLPVC